MPAPPSTDTPVPRRSRHPVAIVFLTLYIDLLGFSIIFPLLPDLYHHYLSAGDHAALVETLRSIAARFGNHASLPEVLFGGILSSVFSSLQFVFAPFWGSLSDKWGRRPILLLSVAGTALSYVIWIFSGSFLIFILARVIGGVFTGNMSVATAAIADITTKETRSKYMGAIGAAFGLGLVTGPMLGAFSMRINLLDQAPFLAAYGINPFSVPALLALLLSLINLLWIKGFFSETLSREHRNPNVKTTLFRNRFRAIFSLKNTTVRYVSLMTFLHSCAFVAMETTLVFLSAQRLHYTARENGYLLAFLGVCAILTQAILVPRLLEKFSEQSILRYGLLIGGAGLFGIAFSYGSISLHLSIMLTSIGSGMVNPSSTGLISINTHTSEQGHILGIFKSLGALSRAIIPLLSGLLFWVFGAKCLYILVSSLSFIAWFLGRKLSIRTG